MSCGTRSLRQHENTVLRCVDLSDGEVAERWTAACAGTSVLHTDMQAVGNLVTCGLLRIVGDATFP